ncbi:MAG: adenosylhomocysteinase [Clostridia bacterium]|nr:adenosylhomocysteinase [Clostridia bacterium]
MSNIYDPSLAPLGEDKIRWVASYMPLLNAIGKDFEERRPLAGLRVAMSIHLEAKTAYLALTLAKAGAEVSVTGSNPLSTRDDIAAALVARGITVFAHHGASEAQYKQDLQHTLACRPQLILDDGGDFVGLLHGACADLAAELRGGCEETTTGVIRLRARERDGSLAFPMISVNDAACKHLFDNRYGTGQSTLTAIMAVTNLTIASRSVVVAGYGWCGKGVAMRARGLGARVIITETDAVKALEACMDGFEVMTMAEAAAQGDIFITVTGCIDVITAEHFKRMKDGVLLANAGHFDCEINKHDLEALAAEILPRKPHITGYRMADGRMLNLLAEGRLVNLAAGMGHPAEIMDMSFALQAKSLEYLATADNLDKRLYAVPPEIDRSVAEMKLSALRIAIDRLTPRQEEYLHGYSG